MMTLAQIATLKTAIAAETDAEFVALRDAGATGAMADWYNVAAAPAFTVWRTNVSDQEIMLNGFDWTRVDNLSIGKGRVWDWMFRFGTINPSKPNIRAGIDQTWVGSAQDLAVRAAVYVHCKRPATRGEKLFTTGTGTDVAPGMLVFEGNVSGVDVVAALQ